MVVSLVEDPLKPPIIAIDDIAKCLYEPRSGLSTDLLGPLAGKLVLTVDGNVWEHHPDPTDRDSLCNASFHLWILAHPAENPRLPTGLLAG
jgi:hypothetical protein